MDEKSFMWQKITLAPTDWCWHALTNENLRMDLGPDVSFVGWHNDADPGRCST